MPLNQIEIRTEEINEILGKAPNSIIRWGITVVVTVILLLLIGSWFFKYPDIIRSTIEITTVNPPADIIAKASGKIELIYVQDNEAVVDNQVLAIIENPAAYSDILKVKSILDSLSSIIAESSVSNEIKLFLPNDMKLGELQSNVSVFESAYNNLVNFKQLDYFNKKKDAVHRQIADYGVYYKHILDQKKTFFSDLELTEKDYKRYQTLYVKQAIAETELENAQSRYLSKKYAYESILVSLANINIQIAQLDDQLLDFQLQEQQQQEKLQLSLNEAYNNLNAQLDIWEQRYVLKSPVIGLCSFSKYWSGNQNITLGEKVMTILPHETGNIIGKLLLPLMGSGKVHLNQRVNIKLQNYPYMEFGMIEGKIQSISAIPDDDFYYVEVSFPKGMKTNYGKEIVFSQKMKGSAEIITDDIRLLQRILQPLRSILKERTGN